MTKQTYPLSIRVRIDLGSVSSIGPGKVALLEHIDSSGSLSQAARELGMSYRRAWLLLDDLNHAFAEPVATASAGGAGGGGAQLTELGKKIIAAYRCIEQEASDAARRHLGWLQESQPVSRPGTSASRRPINQPVVKSPATRAAKRAPKRP